MLCCGLQGDVPQILPARPWNPWNSFKPAHVHMSHWEHSSFYIRCAAFLYNFICSVFCSGVFDHTVCNSSHTPASLPLFNYCLWAAVKLQVLIMKTLSVVTVINSDPYLKTVSGWVLEFWGNWAWKVLEKSFEFVETLRPVPLLDLKYAYTVTAVIHITIL